MAVGTQKESFEQSREIENEIATLKQDLAMEEGNAAAKEAAYRTVRDSTQGGYALVAPRNGIVSSILKKPGEFVEPGMAVAVVTGGGGHDLIVRMHIPNNIKRPEIGEALSIVRTGFPKDIRKAKLIGIGGALDETGSLSADALLTDVNDWPIGASVRVLTLQY